ncbi:MFS transporter [Gryllotalpicola sp.]|uniref:MFS transporter n=1 Tax=Gryllotalpicola sp. TaxID=1932787 RepID=UPI002630975B|nr:MFS transporter [Gryllotalpicola sp.]
MTETVAARASADPTRRVPGRWITAFAVAWLGIWTAQLTPIQLLLPTQIGARFGASDLRSDALWFGIVSGIAGVFAIVVYPLTGALSDRTRSRFGRRRPWIVVGTVVFAAGLVLLGLQSTLAGIAVFWSVSLIGFCILTAALTATISDQVPVGQRGYVSGWLSAPQALGVVLGLALVAALSLGAAGGYLLVAGLLVVLVIPFLFLPDAAHRFGGRALSLRTIVSDLWISPRRYPDFGWTLLGRVLVNLSNALGTTMLLYFLIFQLGNSAADAANNIVVTSLIYVVFVIVASLVLGQLSDRLGRRKLFVGISSIVQAVAALLLAFFPSWDMLLVASALTGLGYGCFLSVDQALATQVLPDPETRGKDLGIMNLAWAIPQAFGPLLGAVLVFFAGSFTWLFVAAAVIGLLGAGAVWFVKSVR